MPVKQKFDDVADWPDAPKPAEAGPGHNKPPVEEQVKAEFRDELLRDRPDFMQRYEDILAASKRVAVTDDETLGKAGDLIKIIRAAGDHVTVTHKTVKQPYLDGGRAADAEKNALLGNLEDARSSVNGLMNEFMSRRAAAERAERERREAEERAAAQAAAEAGEGEAVPLAAAAPAKPQPVRSDAGSTVSGREVWNCQVEDYAKAYRKVKTDPKVQQAIDAAIGRLVRAGQREIPGVRIWPTTQAVAR